MNSNSNKLLYQTLGSFGYALVVFGAMCVWANSEFSFVTEATFTRFFSTVRAALSPSEKANEAYLKTHTLLIDAQSEGILVSKGAQQGNFRIIDRSKVDTLLSQLSCYSGQKRVVLCDLVFDTPDKNDSSFAARIRNTPGLFWPEQSARTTPALAKAVPGNRTGYVDYHISEGWGFLTNKLIKFPVRRGKNKSLALRMFEYYRGKDAELRHGYWKLGDNLYSNNILVDETLRNYNLSDSYDQVYPIQMAIELLKAHDVFAQDLANRDLVVIGDFKSDVHETSLGSTPGALINLNLFAAMIKGENIISYYWAAAMVILLTMLIQVSLFFPEPLWLKNLKANFLRFTGSALGSVISLSLHVSIISAISFIGFGVTFEIIPCATFIAIIYFVRRCFINFKLLHEQHHGAWWHKLLFVLFHKPDTLNRYTI